MRVLVVGGAGYIGSHTARLLASQGHEPVIFDNLRTGHASVSRLLGLPFIHEDLASGPERLAQVLSDQKIDAVMHFAAFALVEESVHHPAKYYSNNLVATFNLLEAMRQSGVNRFIFSSTCATYGDPIATPMDENHPQSPVNPYGRSKLMVERMLKDYSSAYGLRFASLRYFNAAGSSPDGLLGEQHDPETHLIPLCLLALLGRRNKITIFGTDYDTPDGTCIRDYIHVDDLAEAHILALEKITERSEPLILNLGSEHGYSVREVITSVERVTGQKAPIVEGARRPGDPPSLVASAGLARAVLKWRPRYRVLDEIVATAYIWFKKGGRYDDSLS